ncbi:hypothetical protein BJV77DRAFT_1029464, partial [Russula vinacea]
MYGIHRNRLCTVLGCESGASEANRLSKRGVCGQAGGVARICAVFAPVSTLLLCASLVRVSRKSGLLDDRRRGRRSVISELGEA